MIFSWPPIWIDAEMLWNTRAMKEGDEGGRWGRRCIFLVFKMNHITDFWWSHTWVSLSLSLENETKENLQIAKCNRNFSQRQKSERDSKEDQIFNWFKFWYKIHPEIQKSKTYLFFWFTRYWTNFVIVFSRVVRALANQKIRKPR